MTDFIEISGRTVSGLVVGAGTELEIGPGGTAIDTLIKDGGSEIVFSGGFTISTTVRAGGYEFVSSGGTAAETGVKDGGYLEISSGGLASSAAVSAGGTLIVSAGGSAIDTGSGVAAVVMVTSLVQSGQTVSGLVIGSDTVLEVASGGFALSTTVVQGGGETVFSGGSAADTVVSGSGSLTVSSGGAVTDTVVESGGTFALLSGASMTGTVVSSGADATVTQVVGSGAVSSGLVANPVASVTVLGGGTATGMAVLSGGSALTEAGGTEIGTVIAAGGFDAVSGISDDATVSGSMTVEGGVVSDAVIAGSGELVVEAAPLGIGVASDVTITGSGSVDLANGGEAGGMIVFGGDGSLILDGDMTFATLSGFSAGNSVALADVPYDSGGTATFSNGSLVVTENGQNYILQFAGTGPGDFELASDGGDGTLITLASLPCFVAGTLIETAAGPKPVETLGLGDQVMTMDGTTEPVIWIGSRAVDCARHPEPALIRPVMIRAHAFGPGRPARTLLLSPDHAVFAEHVLIPVKHLLNGSTIRQAGADRVTYFHIELPRHAVILAERLPVESYLDTGDRHAFSGADGARTLHPVFGSERAGADVALIMEVLACAPLRVTGPEVERLRATVARAAERLLPSGKMA